MMTQGQQLATGRAPGKIILLGEHAVVYGRPAIAAPVQQVQAHVVITPADVCTIEAVDLGERIDVAAAPADNPFACMVRLLCAECSRPLPSWRLTIHSEIPIAAGLGSGAAISAAIARAMLAAWRVSLPPKRLSALVYEVEKIHHGVPSGIDNTVVVYQRPVYFVKGRPPLPFSVTQPLHFLIADTGVASPTKLAVGDVRRAWQADRERYESLFDAIGECAHNARSAIEKGDLTRLGALMTANQHFLAEIGVSSPEVEALVDAAMASGSLGAKLSGGGRGGNVIALVPVGKLEQVRRALKDAGAARVIQTAVSPSLMV